MIIETVPYADSYAPMPSPQRACCDSTVDELHTDRCSFPHGVAAIDIPASPGEFEEIDIPDDPAGFEEG